jgi:NADH:ubiquinone oxidoreductase subunit 6 (subunit J)
LGRLLMDDYAVPFELVSLILIAALVGAIVFTRPDAQGEP